VALDDEMLEDVLGRGGIPASALEARNGAFDAVPPVEGS